MPEILSGIWGGDSTDHAMEGLRIPDAREPEARYTEAREPGG